MGSNEGLNKKKFQFPHAFVILFTLVVVAAIITWIIPAGNFERVTDETTGLVMMDADSYHQVEATPVGPYGLFLCIQKGFVSASSIVFLIFFAYFCVFTVTKTGSLHAAINALLKLVKGHDSLLIPIFFVIFALAGSTYGEWDTIYGLIPIFVGLAMALGYDAMVGMAMSGMAVAIGFASATTNPFSLGIAQGIAELPLFSGIGLRIIMFVVFSAVGIIWIMRYAAKVKKDPTKSLMAGVDMGNLEMDRSELDGMEFTAKRKLTIVLLFGTIGIIVYSTLKKGWYLDEMSAMFLFSAIIISIVWKMKPNEIVSNFLTACKDIIVGALIVGISRAIMVVMQEGNILDTVIYALYQPLKVLPTWVAAEGMLIFQNIMNLFIPSGSGQATAVMPIMVPLSDLVGLNRQIAVLAYQMGDGYSNLFWPTGSTIIMCGIAKIPLNKWWRFFVPLFGIMLVLEAVFIAIACAINYGPF